MFYYYLRYFNWFSSIFGLPLPFLSESNKVRTRLFTVWSFIVSTLFIVNYFYPNDFWSVKKVTRDLHEISGANNLIVNVIIILINLCNGGKLHRKTYEIVNNIIKNLQIQTYNLKLFAIKFYLWMILPLIVYIVTIVVEMIYTNPPYTLIVKMPMFLSLTHLILHLTLLLAALKVINRKISEKLQLHNRFFLEDCSKTTGLFRYLFCPTIKMYKIDSNIQKGQYNLYLLCTIYDEIGVCITLLEKSHGTQVLLSIWLMFSNAVTGIALITTEQANIAWVVVVRGALPFFWYFMGCYVDNQIREEVERTEMLIVKHLIDFRCDNSTREALQTFKEVMAANRLEFTACNLFRLNYSTILGIIVNIITYSIILVQIM